VPNPIMTGPLVVVSFDSVAVVAASLGRAASCSFRCSLDGIFFDRACDLAL
jgi:hypothetical protein